MRTLFLKGLIFKKRDPKRQITRIAASLLTVAFMFLSCNPAEKAEPAAYGMATEVALSWNQLALDLERHTLGYRPPVSARMFAYAEMAAYEAALPALHDYISLETLVDGYEKPAIVLDEARFYLPASLNAAYAQIFHHFFATAEVSFQSEIDQLEKKYRQTFQKNFDAATLEASARFGKAVATQVWNWSKTDKEGHDAHLYNYAHGYEPPVCRGCWQPTGEHPKPALLPFWGNVRPFVCPVAEISIKNPVNYEEAPGSEFYTEAMEVYSVSKPLSKENRWIAEFWSDDVPGLTCSPSGRWISIANQALEKARPPFPLVIETYLKTAFALCDAGVGRLERKIRL